MINEYKREATRQELIEEIEKLQKENKELKYKYDKALSDLVKSDKNSIPKDKIENKIKELEKGLILNNITRLYTLRDSYELQISVLKELLEEEK